MKAAAHVAASALVLAALCGAPARAMTLTSPDISPDGVIANGHVYKQCGGANISPALVWSGVPASAKSLVLTMIDIDVAPALWSHWIVIDLPPETSSLPRGVAQLPAPARAIASDFGEAAYGGPCPPKGSGTHHYEFSIWAMPAATTAVERGLKAKDLRTRLSLSAIDHATFIGTVTR